MSVREGYGAILDNRRRVCANDAFYDTGGIALYTGDYIVPKSKQAELSELQLRGYANQAIHQLANFSVADSLDLARVETMYSTEHSKLADPQIDYEVIRKTNGIPWGPGRWGKVCLVNFTGEVSFAMASRTFSQVEDTVGTMSQEECSHYAAAAVLSIKNKE